VLVRERSFAPCSWPQLHSGTNQERTKLELGSRKVTKQQASEQRGAHISALSGQEPEAPWAELTWGPAHQWGELSHPLPPAQGLEWGCRYLKPRAPHGHRGWESRLIPRDELLRQGRNTCKLPGKTINNVCTTTPASEPAVLGGIQGQAGEGCWCGHKEPPGQDTALQWRLGKVVSPLSLCYLNPSLVKTRPETSK